MPAIVRSSEHQSPIDVLRELILAKEYTRRYAAFLCADSQLIAVLAADGEVLLRDMLAGLGVPLLHRKHVAGFVREAQSISEAGPADMDQSVDHEQEAAASAVETDDGEGEATASCDEMDVVGDAAASFDGVQGVGDAVVGVCSSGSDSHGAVAVRRDESASESSFEDLAASSDEVIPAPKARLFSSSSFGGDAWSLFRAKLLGSGGDIFPCLANGRVSVRRSSCGHGLGLFAGVVFEKGALLVVYGGDLRTAAECASQGSHAVALAETSRGLYIDSAAVCARLVEQPGGDCAPQVGMVR